MQDAQGLYITNGNSEDTCKGYYAGTCTNTALGARCGRDATKVHQCNKCLRNNHLGCKHREGGAPEAKKSAGGIKKKAKKKKGGQP